MSDAVAVAAPAAPVAATETNAAPQTQSGTQPPTKGEQSSSAPPDISSLLAQIDSDDKVEALQRELLKRKPVTIKTKHGEKKIDSLDLMVEHTRRRETLDEDLMRMADERRQLTSIQQRIDAVSKGDRSAIKELLQNPNAMGTVAQMLKEQYLREQQLDQLPPEQRAFQERYSQMEEQLQYYQQQEQLKKQQQEQQQQEQMSQQVKQEISSRAASILKTLGYKNGDTGAAYALRTLVPILREVMTAGVDVPDAHLAEMVKSEHSARAKQEFGALSGEEIMQLYPDVAQKVLDSLRAKRQAERARLEPVVTQQPQQQRQPNGHDEGPEDLDAKMKRFGLRL